MPWPPLPRRSSPVLFRRPGEGSVDGNERRLALFVGSRRWNVLSVATALALSAALLATSRRFEPPAAASSSSSFSSVRGSGEAHPRRQDGGAVRAVPGSGETEEEARGVGAAPGGEMRTKEQKKEERIRREGLDDPKEEGAAAAAAAVPTRDRVSCGGHFAPSCRSCPQGHGPGWCNGQCAWDATSNDCVDRPTNVHPMYHEIISLYAFQPVVDQTGEYVNIICVRAPLRSDEEWRTYEKYKDELLFLGISSFETFPLSSPNPYSANFSNDLYVGMFPGFLHMERDPKGVFPPHVKTLLMSQSDFFLPEMSNHEVESMKGMSKSFDFVFSGTDQDVDNGCVGWASFAKNWSFALQALEVMCKPDFGLRGVLVATVNKANTTSCPIPPSCEGTMVQTPFLDQGTFHSYLKRSRFAFLPQVYDASPRVITQALALNVPLLMNRNIRGGWKYLVPRITGEFFRDLSDFEVSLRRLLGQLDRNEYKPHQWTTERYGNKLAGARLLDFVRTNFGDRVDLPEGVTALIPTGA